jgi:hypothetical protein
MYEYLLLVVLAVIIGIFLWPKKEGYFTYYQGMPGIPKTYISTGFIRNPGRVDECWQSGRIY